MPIDRWKVEETLTAGGQGEIALVRDRTGERSGVFALKRLKHRAHPVRLGRFRREIEVGLTLSHPGILRPIDYDLETDRPYFVTDYLSLGSFANYDFSSWDVVRKLRLFHKVCLAVGHAHGAKVIHRDIKPDNLLLRSQDEPVVADFGLCLVDDDLGRLTDSTEAVGSRWYMAPELEDGFATDVTPLADVYSLGKVLYWLLAGRVFSREKYREGEYNLTTSDAREMFIVYALFDGAIRDRSFKDAIQLSEEVALIIKRIEAGMNEPGWGIPQWCIYCGAGKYEIVGENLQDPEKLGDRALNLGIYLLNPNSKLWVVLECERCGNIQMFRRRSRDKPFPWNPPRPLGQ